MTYEAFKQAVQRKIRFWTGELGDDAVVEINSREGYALKMYPEQVARDIVFNE